MREASVFLQTRVHYHGLAHRLTSPQYFDYGSCHAMKDDDKVFKIYSIYEAFKVFTKELFSVQPIFMIVDNSLASFPTEV